LTCPVNIMDPPNNGVAFCAIILEMLIRKHINYYQKYDGDHCVPFETAFVWVITYKNFYRLKMKELALAPIGDGLKPFSYEYWFTFENLEHFEESARAFLGEVYGINPLDVDKNKTKHFMQIACEYFFTEIDIYQPVIEMIFISTRMRKRRGQDTPEQQEEAKARLLYIKDNTNSYFHTDFLGTTECPVCFHDSVLDPCCSRLHTLCRVCWLDPRVPKCPLCREVRALF